MKIHSHHNDENILTELGERLELTRIEKGFTQAELANNSGVSKRTIERIEAGKSAQLSSLIRILRALNLLDAIETGIPRIRVTEENRKRRSGRRRIHDT